MQVKVHLKPHRGIQDTDAGRVWHTHKDQQMVYFTSDEMVGEKFIGYLRTETGGAFLPTPTFVDQPEGLKELILEAVNVAAGDPRPLGIVPLSPKVLEEIDKAEDDDEPDDTETTDE